MSDYALNFWVDMIILCTKEPEQKLLLLFGSVDKTVTKTERILLRFTNFKQQIQQRKPERTSSFIIHTSRFIFELFKLIIMNMLLNIIKSKPDESSEWASVFDSLLGSNFKLIKMIISFNCTIKHIRFHLLLKLFMLMKKKGFSVHSFKAQMDKN